VPWILRFAIGWLLIFVIGAMIIAWACVSTGWEAIGRFASGLLTAGAGLIGSALFSVASAVIQQRWRTFSLVLSGASVLLFLLLLIFARFA
jgi:hypothetical protein